MAGIAPTYHLLGTSYVSGASNIAGAGAGAWTANDRGGATDTLPTGEVASASTARSAVTSQAIVMDGPAGSVDHALNKVTLKNAITDAFRTTSATGTVFSILKANANLLSAQFTYQLAANPTTAVVESIPLTQLHCSLAEGLAQEVVSQSLRLELNGRTYYDRNGIVYYRDANGVETQAGSIDYATGRIALTSWVAGTLAAAVNFVVTYGRWNMTDALWRVNAASVRAASFQMTYTRTGQTVPDQATSDNAGAIAGAGGLTGTINYDTGVYKLAWAASSVVPELARYNAVAVNFLPLDPAIIGLDPVRLSTDGKIPTIQNADVAVLHNTQTTTLPNPAVAGSTYATRPYISTLEIRDQLGALIPTDRYTWSKTTGDVTMANPLNLTGYTQPLIVTHRIEDMLLVTDAQLSGYVGFNAQITHAYPANTSFLSTALPLGNELQASAYNVYSQATWTSVWSDLLIGSPATGQYNATVAPILTTNKGAIRERWRVEFTSVTAFKVIGETVGQVGVGDVTTNCAPINPATGDPYFTLQAAGWSAGWAVGNQLRFNTEAAARPIWFNRCTLPGPLTDPTDRFQLELRGDAN